MRRGKGDEKMVGPLFPRLHVNDTAEKGGPRAPPRNKMALYEQLTVPFQRFNPNSNSSSNRVLQPPSLNLKPVMSVKNTSAGEVVDSPVRKAKVITDQEDQHCPVSNITRLHQGDACLQQECITGSQSNDIEDGDGILDSTMDMSNRNTHVSSDESDDLSKISGVENLPSQKLSPDGVSKILGQKLFWKARRKITNQQRAFAVQVFELHRLIQVQQQFAGSPDLLLEAAAFIGKFPLEGSTPKNLTLEVVIEPQQQNLKQHKHSEKLNRKMEHSAENAVGNNTSFSSQKNGSHLSNYTLFPGNPHQENVAANDKTGSWPFDPSRGHQWLVPVMSPSEGLVYKPYPGPGFACGPFGQGPLDSTFLNPYGVSSFHQAIADSPFIPPGSYSYYPHGAMVMNQSASVSAVVQVNQFSAQGQNGHSSIEAANQNSSNLPNQKNAATKFQVSKKRELQGSCTASSPNEMAQRIRTKKFATKGRDAHSHSIKAPLVLENVLQSLETRKHTQVIKVVPHNPRSATESVARIFQSIQEERNQYDFV